MDDFELDATFLAHDDATRLFKEILEQALWRAEHLRMFGRVVRSPRQVCWYGDAGVGYRYSGVDHWAQGWLAPLQRLRDDLQEHLGAAFNFVLLNHYSDQQDSMGWHSDDEPELGTEPTIASISLGAERAFRVRPAEPQPGVRRLSKSLDLGHGSLLVMRGRSQQDFQHALPKATAPCGPRLNLTFRQVIMAESH